MEKKIKILEHDVQKTITDYLTYKNIICWRTNSGAMKIADRFIKFMSWIWPISSKIKSYSFLDISGMLDGGRYFTIEIKTPGKKPTDAQNNTISLICNRGGIAFYADSVDMMLEKFKNEFGVYT